MPHAGRFMGRRPLDGWFALVLRDSESDYSDLPVSLEQVPDVFPGATERNNHRPVELMNVRHAHRSFSNESGTTAIEFGFIATPLFLLLFGAVEGGKVLWLSNSLQYAVEQAARCAAVNQTTCGSTANTQAYAASKVIGGGVTSAAFTVTTASCGIQVSASVPYQFVNLLPFNVTLTAMSCRPT